MATYNYTLVLSNGQAYQNVAGGDIAEVQGLSYDSYSGVWTMDNVNFDTSALTALKIEGDAATTIAVIGENFIEAGEDTSSPVDGSLGAILSVNTSLQGTDSLTDSLTITTGASSMGSSDMEVNDGLSIQGITFTTKTTSAVKEGLQVYGGLFSVKDAEINLVYSLNFTGTDVYAVVDGTGKITANNGVSAYNEPLAAACDEQGNELTWDGSKYITEDGSDAVTVVLSSPVPSITVTAGHTYLYDNTSTKMLEAGDYLVAGLDEGDYITNVSITTNSANAGIYDADSYTLSYIILNAACEDVTSKYSLVENKSDVEITKRTITIAADDASKVYDGTALTCHTYTVQEGETEAEQLFEGENVAGVDFTADSTLTHVGSTANKIDASNLTIRKADGSDSSMNYNISISDGTLSVTARGVLLQSTSADKFYDGTALQSRQVMVTGFHYDENGNVVVDTDGGFLDGDGCTYNFVNDNWVIDKNSNSIGWDVSEQSDTKYGQTEVGTSKNEFNYDDFTSVYCKRPISPY